MPSKSEKQAKFMRAVAHSPSFAKKVGVSQNVGKDFEMADKKTKKFGGGGWSGRGGVRIPLDDSAPTGPTITPRRGTGPTAAERAEAAAQNKRLKDIKVTPKEGKIIDSANRSEGGGQAKGGKIVKKYAKGGVTKEMPTANQMGSMNMKKGGKVAAGKSDKAGRALVKKSADTMGRAMKFAKGGSIDGCAKKGKTNTKMVKMARGGKMKKGC